MYRRGPAKVAVLAGSAILLGMASLPSPAATEMQWSRWIEVARGDGHQGPWRMNESVFRYVDDPTVAVNEHGLIGVAWVDQADKNVFFQLYDTKLQPRLEEPTNVSRSPRIFSWLPRIILTADDPLHVYVLWQEIVFSGGSHGGEAFFARSTDGGRTFSAPLNLSQDQAGSGKGRIHAEHWHNGSLDIAIGPGGHLYAAWTDYEGSLWLSRSTDRGARFSPPLRITGGRGGIFARAPALAVGNGGTVYLTWTVGGDPAADLRFAMSTDDGQTFTKPRVLFDSDGYADAPKIAVDGDGVIHLAYGESVAGPDDRYSIHYARSMDRGRSFETPREVSHPHTHRFGSVNFPGLSLGAPGTVYLVWELYPLRGNRPRGLGFSHSDDGGRSFHPPSVVPGSRPPDGVNGSLQGLLMEKIASNTAGRVAIVNSTFDPGDASRIWLFPARAVSRAQ